MCTATKLRTNNDENESSGRATPEGIRSICRERFRYPPVVRIATSRRTFVLINKRQYRIRDVDRISSTPLRLIGRRCSIRRRFRTTRRSNRLIGSFVTQVVYAVFICIRLTGHFSSNVNSKRLVPRNANTEITVYQHVVSNVARTDCIHPFAGVFTRPTSARFQTTVRVF